MKKISFSFLLCIYLATAMLITPKPARAALGESADSIATDRHILKAVKGTTTSYGSYSVHELKSGPISVREYVTSSGVVFAIAWNGLTHPDLAPLLGSFVKEYTEGLRNAPHERGRRSGRVATNHLVVEKWGHLRSLHGRAYLKALMPPEVTVNEIN
jgi:hypothetical protein